MDNRGTVERAVDRYMPSVLRPLWNGLIASEIGYRLLHGAFWSTFGAAMLQALMLITSIVVARVLGREQFGEYGIVLTTVGMFGIFAGFGLGTTATKFVAEYKLTEPEKAGRIVALSTLVALATGVVAAAVLLLGAPLLSARTLAAAHLSAELQVSAGIVLFSAINSAQVGVLAGFEAFKAIARLNVITAIASCAFTIIGLALGGLLGALAGQVAAFAAGCLVTSRALRAEMERYKIPLQYSGCTAEKGVLINFSFPAVMSGIMVSPVTWACTAILVNQPNGYLEMGLFNAANSWQKAILFLPNSVGAIALPMLSRLAGTADQENYTKALWYNMALTAALAFLVAGCVAAASKPVMQSYGEGFVHGQPVLVLLCFAAALSATCAVIGNAIASIGKMWWGLLLNLMWAMVLLFSAWVLKEEGAKGLALAYCIAYLFHLATTAIFTKTVLVKHIRKVHQE